MVRFSVQPMPTVATCKIRFICLHVIKILKYKRFAAIKRRWLRRLSSFCSSSTKRSGAHWFCNHVIHIYAGNYVLNYFTSKEEHTLVHISSPPPWFQLFFHQPSGHLTARVFMYKVHVDLERGEVTWATFLQAICRSLNDYNYNE